MQGWMIGTVISISLMAWMPVLPPLEPLLMCCAVAAVACVFSPRRPLCFVLGLLMGASYSVYWGGQLTERLGSIPSSGLSLELSGVVLAPAQQRLYSGGVSRQRFQFYSPKFEGCTLLLSYYGPEKIRAGQQLSVYARLKPPWGLANQASFNYQTWLTQNGFCGTGYVSDDSVRVLKQVDDRVSHHNIWRQAAYDQIATLEMTPSMRGLILALSLGDRSQIPSRQWTLISGLGLSHLFVISGLHVGLVAGFGFLLGAGLSRLLLPLPGPPVMFHVLPRLFAMLAAVLFSAMAGFALPTQRALIMLLVIQLMALGHRRLQPQRSLFLAAFAVSVFDPLCTQNPGFWLSFSAVCLIFYLLHLWQHDSGLRKALQIQLLLAISMGLLASFWFGGFSLLAPLANVLMVPLVSLILVPLCLLALVLMFVHHGAAATYIGCLNALVEALPPISENLTWLLEPAWLSFNPDIVQIAIAAVALFGLLTYRHALRWHLAALCIPLLFVPNRGALSEGVLKMTVFDVGQGLSVLVQSHDFNLLYDTGGGDPSPPNMASTVILPHLKRQGIEALDVLVVSHGDRDHAAGAGVIRQQLPVSEIWYGEHPLPNAVSGLAEHQTLQRACSLGGIRQYGEITATLLVPKPSSAVLSSNDQSCVLLLESAGFRILIPGDIGAGIERALVRQGSDPLAADVLIVPHHGSNSSSSGPFLRSVAPTMAIVSAGYLNRFGHPREEVIARYQRLDTHILNTALDGAISMTVVGGELSQFQAWRQSRTFYWQ